MQSARRWRRRWRNFRGANDSRVLLSVVLAALAPPLLDVAGAGVERAELFASRDLATAANESIPSAANASMDAPDRLDTAPRVASYRNAYGTHFSCGSTCLIIAGVYYSLVCCLLLLLCLLPLQKREHATDAAAARLWLGEKEHAPTEASGKPVRERGWLARAVRWIARRVLPRGAVVRDEEEACENFHDEYLRVTQALTSESRRKTYESIGVATDDLSFLGSGDDVVVVDDPERLFDDPSSRLSIASDGRGEASVGAGSEAVIVPKRSTIVGSTPASSVFVSTPDLIEQHRRMMLTGYQLPPSESKEDMVRAVERREIAKPDISYENLGDEEIQMYEYLSFVRQLQEGISLKKVCQSSAKVVKRTFFLNAEMTTVFWNKVGSNKWMTRKSSIQVAAIDEVLKGLDGNPGLASRDAAGYKSFLYVSILCTDGKRLTLEANDESARQRLLLGFSRLAMEKRLALATAHPSSDVSSDEGADTAAFSSTEATNLSPVRRLAQRSPAHSSQLNLVMEEEEKDDERHWDG